MQYYGTKYSQRQRGGCCKPLRTLKETLSIGSDGQTDKKAVVCLLIEIVNDELRIGVA